MPLFEAVTIEVGAAIAKSILKLWVKDSTLGDDISSSLIDVLKSRTSDILAQRRGQRQFETIGEKVGESLLPLFESEGTRLDEGSRIAVAYEVAAAFNKSKLSSELLAKHNLEPTELAKHILAAHSIAGQPFTETEKAFYQRIIQESCAYVVDIASQLPVFTERTFAEVLKREDQILARTDQILQEIHRLREQLDPMTEAGRFEEDYRKGVVRNLDVLQLFGTDVSTANQRHRLSVAYITLSVAQQSQAFPKNRHPARIVVDQPSKSFENEMSREIVSVDTALARSRCLLIRGLAGSGKTTLLQWIAVKSALKSFDGALSGWNDTLPFFIRLRHCVQSGLPKPEVFPGLVVPAIADTMPKGWVHAQLQSGRAIVLVDGLDEVPALRREDVGTWLKELVETYPRARFIITSRPHAVEEGWMDSAAFRDAELQPMEMPDISLFIDHWHQAVREELQEDEEKAELPSLASHLLENVRRNRSIRNLATSPLLCAMLCALNRDRRQQLPADRIELYEACCALLLERRDKERRIELTDYPVLNYRQKRLLLEDLAYWMIKNNWSEVPLQLVDERFARKLPNMPSIVQDVSGSRVRRLFVERAGIIREPVAGKIDFTHRTFQEFLAAKSATDEMDTGLLVENATDDQWREVIILASGLATKQMREELIMGLIARGDTNRNRYQLHLLAVSCLETSVELGQEVRAEVEKRLSQLVPPKNIEDAKELAVAGELAVKYLAYKSGLNSSTTAACIHALTLIGGDAALEVLEGYANDTRKTVIDELLRAWDSFDRDDYARHVLSQTLRSRSYLKFERLLSLQGIQYFINLRELDLSFCEQIRDLSPLAGLTQVTTLSMSDCGQVRDLSPLASLVQLTNLNLSFCEQIRDLSPLVGLAQLTNLNLSSFEQVSDLSSLAGLTQVTNLDLSSFKQVRDLSPLADLAQMTSLSLSACEQVSDLSPLAGLTQLRNLTLRSCRQVGDLSPLASLTQLRNLILWNCRQVGDLSPLASLTQLTELDLSFLLQVSDLSPLAGLTQLKKLSLWDCSSITDLSPLAGLNSLEELMLNREMRDKVVIPQSIKEKVKFV